MKRIALLCLLAIGCATGPRAKPVHPHIFGDLQSQLTLQQGAIVGVPASGYKTLFFDTSGNFTQMDSTGTRSTVGGQPFGTPFQINQPNSVNAQFQTWQFQNRFTNNTSGSETATNEFTVPLNGAAITQDFAKANGAGRQVVTTSGATPSVAWNPRSDLLVVTIGATPATGLTITGTDLDTDWCYAIEGTTIPAATNQLVDLDVNGTTSGYAALEFFGHSTAGFANLTRFQIQDGGDNTTKAMFHAHLCGAPGAVKTFHTDNFIINATQGFIETVMGVTTSITSNVTSLVFNTTNGGLPTGSVIGIRRDRAFAN